MKQGGPACKMQRRCRWSFKLMKFLLCCCRSNKSYAAKRLRNGQRGVILLGLIITMVLFSTLGAVLVPLTSSSSFSGIVGNMKLTAYYLAESGYRYASSQYISVAGEAARDNMLNTLHNKTYTMRNNGGSFKLMLYPYFFKVSADPVGTTTLSTSVKGGFPAGMTLPATGWLVVVANGCQKGPFNYTSRSIVGSTITFTIATTLPSIAVDSTVLPVVPSAAASQTVVKNGNITLGAGYDALPELNGAFLVPGTTGNLTMYKYKKRVGNTLQNVTLLNTPDSAFSLTISAGTNIVLLKYLYMESTGTLGSGIMQSTRTVKYSLPLYTNIICSTPTAPNVDQAALAANSGGVFTNPTVDGGSALNATMAGTEGYVGFPSDMAAAFYTAWVNSGQFLSYDAQVKLTTGQWDGTTFINKPNYYATGIAFRYTKGATTPDDTFLGLSFIRTMNGSDGIPDTMAPAGMDGKTMIMLWQRTGSSAYSWLSYKELSTANYVYDASGLKNWSTIMVRIVEAASIKLASATSITGLAVGSTITDAGGRKATLIRIIKDSDGVVVLLLNNVESGFTMPTAVPGTCTPGPTCSTGSYRTKDNYISAFYGDTSDHPTGTPGDTIPNNEVRLLDARSGTIYWPPAGISDWSPAYDHFTIVKWDAIQGGVYLMGGASGAYEYNTIIRTSSFLTTGSYSTASNPELGLVALSDQLSGKAYYSDFAYSIFSSGSGTGGSGFFAPVQQ